MTDEKDPGASRTIGLCVWCRYWQSSRNECRAHPPVVLMSNDFPRTDFPTVSANDWCGEYEAKA